MSSTPAPLTPTQLNLLPQKKFDSTNAIPHLSTLSATELEPLIPGLLSWLEDGNRPIFGPVRDLLQYPDIVVEPVRAVLRGDRGDEGDWISNCLEFIVEKLQMELRVKFRGEIERLRDMPTEEEKEWECQNIAQDILMVLDGDGESNFEGSA